MQLSKYERNRLDQMIRDAEEYKRTHGTEMMIVMSNAGLQGFALRDKSIYPVVWRSDTGIVDGIEVEHKDSARPFISERFERCE